MREETKEIYSEKTQMKDIIAYFSASKDGELILLHPDIYNLLKTNDMHWTEFCMNDCNAPCNDEITDGHFTCQFEMLKWFRNNGILGEKAYPAWLKSLKQFKETHNISGGDKYDI